MRRIAIGTRFTLGAATLALVAMTTAPAHASPKSYDIETLLRQDLPSWRSGAVRPVPPPQGAPLDRQLTAPSAPALTPSAPAFAPRPITPPAIFSAPAPAVISAPPPAALTPAQPPQTGRRVIQAPGSPRSTVSGAWSQ